MTSVSELKQTLNQMVNEHYSTPEMERFFSFPMTVGKAKVKYLQQVHFNMNRRDCWGYVQGSCPPGVKRLIWEHEKEELVCDPRFGGDHHSASLQKAVKVTGLSVDEIYNASLIPGCKAAFHAWKSLARNSPWLIALSASAILERANNNKVVKGGGVSVRDYGRYTDDVLNLLKDIPGHDVHNVADEDHSDMMDGVLDKYAVTAEARREVLIGASDSLDFDRAFRGALAIALEQIE